MMADNRRKTFSDDALRAALSRGESVWGFALSVGCTDSPVYRRIAKLGLTAPTITAKDQHKAGVVPSAKAPGLTVQIDIETVIAALKAGRSSGFIAQSVGTTVPVLLMFLCLNELPRPLTKAARAYVKPKPKAPEHAPGKIEATGGSYAALNAWAISNRTTFREALKLWHATKLPTKPARRAEVPRERGDGMGRAAW
jgi:hypothetical protein